MFNFQIKAEGLADSAQPINWRRLMDTMQRDGYQGEISLATEVFDGTFDKASDAIREIQHIIGQLA
jgi:hypothetical protein